MPKKPEEVRCSFCGASSLTSDRTFVTGPYAAICGPCAISAVEAATSGSTYPREFEYVATTPFGGFLTRLPVPGGWVLSVGAAIAFVPDPNGRWILPVAVPKP